MACFPKIHAKIPRCAFSYKWITIQGQILSWNWTMLEAHWGKQALHNINAGVPKSREQQPPRSISQNQHCNIANTTTITTTTANHNNHNDAGARVLEREIILGGVFILEFKILLKLWFSSTVCLLSCHPLLTPNQLYTEKLSSMSATAMVTVSCTMRSLLSPLRFVPTLSPFFK